LAEPRPIATVGCEDCDWRGPVAFYGKHRAGVHAPPPRTIPPHAQFEHEQAVKKGLISAAKRLSPKRASEIVVIEPAPASPRTPNIQELGGIRDCPDCVWSGPSSEYREHRMEAHKR
jgi:hypothetical protein